MVKTIPYIGVESECSAYTATWCVVGTAVSPSQARKAGSYYVHGTVRIATSLTRSVSIHGAKATPRGGALERGGLDEKAPRFLETGVLSL